MSVDEKIDNAQTLSSRINYAELNESGLYRYSLDATSAKTVELLDQFDGQTRYLIYNIIRWIIVIVSIILLHYKMYNHVVKNQYNYMDHCCDCFNVAVGASIVNDSYYNSTTHNMDWSICDDNTSCKECIQQYNTSNVCDTEALNDFSDCKQCGGTENLVMKDKLFPITLPIITTGMYILGMITELCWRKCKNNILQTWDVIRVTALTLTVYNAQCSVFCHFGLFVRFVYHVKTINTIDGINPKCLVSPIKHWPISIANIAILATAVIFFVFPIVFYIVKICLKHYNLHRCQQRIEMVLEMIRIISIASMIICEISLIAFTGIVFARVFHPDAQYAILNDEKSAILEIVGVLVMIVYFLFGWTDIFCCKFCHYSTAQVFQSRKSVFLSQSNRDINTAVSFQNNT